MGYQRPLLRLKFEDPEMAGLEVVCKRPSVGQIELFDKTDRQLDEQLVVLQTCLISWNLEDEDGNPVPITIEGLKSQDQPFLAALIDAWTGQAVKVPGPLGRSLPSGEPSPVESIPMEALSESPQS